MPRKKPSQLKNQETPTKKLHPFIKHRIKEGFFILTSAVALFLVIALFTYNHADPGWSKTGGNQETVNAAGQVGAYVSDFLLYILGYMAYFIPVALLYLTWAQNKAKKIMEYEESLEDTLVTHHTLLVVKVIGIILTIISGCAFFSLYSGPHHVRLPFTAGGIVGNVVGSNLSKVFNVPGTDLILLAMLLSGITLFTGFSWLSTLKKAALLLTQGFVQFKEQLALKAAADIKLDKQETILSEPSSGKKYRVVTPAPESASDTKLPVDIKIEEKLKLNLLKTKKRNRLPVKTNPPLELLDEANNKEQTGYTPQQLKEMSKLVETKLKDFNINAKVVAVQPGPVVTRFELQLAAGTKASKVTNLAKDLARSMSVTSVRVVEVIAGKSVIGLELPNNQREMVKLREILSSEQYEDASSHLTLALGKDIAGVPVAVNLAKMPHLLVAGTTGSGKSVGINAMLISLLYKASPDQLRLILIDPKMLELSVYEGIPHLLTPVVTDMKDASKALRWCVAEMERRYKLMSKVGVRNLAGFNQKVEAASKAGQPLLDPLWDPEVESEAEALKPLPSLVVVADEFADMIMVVGKKVEELISRIAQKARAAGIHLILATQRPSVDVITGLIKANIPTRIAFQVSSKIDSRTILDQGGAEQLLGHGDMLYLPPGTAMPIRVHGAFVSDDEVHRVVAELKVQAEPEYLDEIMSDDFENGGAGNGDFNGDNAEKDALYDEAVQIVIETRRASISGIQRRLKIGYNRAARMIEAMEAAGVVSPMGSNGTREILVQHQS